MKNISPHVNIYKFPVTAISSIMNRVTGLGITGIYVISGSMLLFNKNPITYYEKLHNYPKTAINYGIIFPTFYHTFGGIRHFIWDKYPHLLSNVKVTQSSIGIIGLSIASSFVYEKYIIKNNLKNILEK
jgi:succinate dehydrogenase (ubiquinone) cytochrome b560 subunit